MEGERRFEEIEHTADIAIRVWGRDLAELFANAAYGMGSLLGVVKDTGHTVKRTIELDAGDVEILLVEWLGELLFFADKDNLVFTDFDSLEVTTTQLRARVRGRRIEERRTYIKAVTFSELEITQTSTGYRTVIVFDV
jgi:SHS2 domain-containing protein